MGSFSLVWHCPLTKQYWLPSWESSLGQLGEKRECYLCAMPPPLDNIDQTHLVQARYMLVLQKTNSGSFTITLLQLLLFDTSVLDQLQDNYLQSLVPSIIHLTTSTRCSCGDNRSLHSTRIEESCRTISRCQSQQLHSHRNLASNSCSDFLSQLWSIRSIRIQRINVSSENAYFCHRGRKIKVTQSQFAAQFSDSKLSNFRY